MQSIERAAAILRLLARGSGRLGVSEIAGSLGLARGTAHGILRTLHGVGFVEQSTSWLQRRWRHERTLVDRPHGGTEVVDHLTIEPRIALARPVTAWTVGRIFDHRHRRLVRRFGAAPA